MKPEVTTMQLKQAIRFRVYISMDQLAWFQTSVVFVLFFFLLQDKILVWASAWEMRLNQGESCNMQRTWYSSSWMNVSMYISLEFVVVHTAHSFNSGHLMYLLVCLYLLPLGFLHATDWCGQHCLLFTLTWCGKCQLVATHILGKMPLLYVQQNPLL